MVAGSGQPEERMRRRAASAVSSAVGSISRYLPVVAMLPWPHRSLTTTLYAGLVSVSTLQWLLWPRPGNHRPDSRVSEIAAVRQLIGEQPLRPFTARYGFAGGLSSDIALGTGSTGFVATWSGLQTRPRPMISFMISVVPPKLSRIAGTAEPNLSCSLCSESLQRAVHPRDEPPGVASGFTERHDDASTFTDSRQRRFLPK